MTLFPRIAELLKKRGADIVLTGGGIIPKRRRGVAPRARICAPLRAGEHHRRDRRVHRKRSPAPARRGGEGMKDSPASNSSADKPPVREIHSPGDAILDFHEAAAFLGVSTKTFAKVLRTEDLPAGKLGGNGSSPRQRSSRGSARGTRAISRTRPREDETEPDSHRDSAPGPREISGRTIAAPEGLDLDSFSVDDD